LVFDSTDGTLSARLTFDLTREPTASELDGLLATVRSELFFTSWGMNLDWDCDPDPLTISIRVTPRVQRHAVIGAG
jgi:hypothetical protein